MKRLVFLSTVFLSACIFGAGGEPFQDGPVDPDASNNSRPTVDCADCSAQLSLRSPPSKPGITKVCPREAQYAYSLAAYASDAGVRAAGVRCVDASVSWEDGAFVVTRGEAVQDWLLVGATGGRLPGPSTCPRDSFAVGVEVQSRDGRLASFNTVCSDLSFRVFREDDGTLSAELTRTPIEPGDIVPASTCADGDCTDPQQLSCPDGSVAIGVVGDLDFGGGVLEDLDVLCAEVILRVVE